MGVDEFASFDVLAGDVVLQCGGFDSPLTAATDLDRRKITTSDEGVGLSGGDIERLGNIRKCQEARGHGCHRANCPF